MFSRLKSLYTNVVNRIDSFRNVLTNYGDALRDKSDNYQIRPSRPLTYQELDWFIRENSLAKKCCVKPAEEMTRDKLKIKLDEPNALPYHTKFQNMNIYEKFKLALIWENAFGGAIIILDVQDGQTLDQPVNEAKIVALGDRMTVLDRSVVRIKDYNPYVDPEIYQINLTDGRFFEIHETRCLVFDGAEVATLSERIENMGFADPILKRLRKPIENLTVAQGTCGQILADFSQTVYKIEGLNDDLEDESGKGEMDVTRRLLTMDRSRSIIRAVVLDKEDDFAREVAPLTGIKEFISIFREYLTTVTDMPHNLLHGESPGASLGESGNGQFIMWYDYINHQRNIRLYGKYERVLRYEAAARNEQEPEFEFCSLWELTDKEKAELKAKEADSILKITQAIKSLWETQSISTEEISAIVHETFISGDIKTNSRKIIDIMKKVSADHTDYAEAA
jgi:phage-related protein (TIGR01555 family)